MLLARRAGVRLVVEVVVFIVTLSAITAKSSGGSGVELASR